MGGTLDKMRGAMGMTMPSQGSAYYDEQVPDFMRNRTSMDILAGPGGTQNLKDLMETRGKVDPAQRDFQIAQVAGGENLAQKRLASAAGRSGLSRSGAFTGKSVGIANQASQDKQRIGAEHTRMSEENRRSDLGQWMNYFLTYLNQLNKRQENLAGAKQGQTASRAGAMKQAFSMLSGGSMGGGK